jgi:uncharacterized protein
MTINEMTEQECRSALSGASFGRLGCSFKNQPYIVPLYFASEAGYIYALGTAGQKIEWMRQNPRVCLQVDDIRTDSEWTSIIVLGRYQELPEPQFAEERAHARELLKQRSGWWKPALAERDLKSSNELIAPIFFRIGIDSLTGLHSTSEIAPGGA